MESTSALTVSFIVYILGIVGLGVYSSKFRRRTKDDYFLANRQLGSWASALSASASSESGWVMLGLVGASFAGGISALWMIPGTAAGYLFNWYVIADRLRKSSKDTGSVTLVQYLSHRFGSRFLSVRIISVLIIAAAMLGYVAAQMNAAGKAFNAIFILPYWLGVLIGAAIILTYTLTGGFRASCWTDVIQASFMAIALIGMPIITLIKIGGFSAVISNIGSTAPELLSLTGGNVGFGLVGLVIGWAGIGLAYPGQPHVLARFMGTKDSESIKQGGIIAFIWSNLIFIGAILFGLFARAYFGTLPDPEQALPIAALRLLPPVLDGFVLAAIISAICSTADSQLLVVASIFSRDVIYGFKKRTGKTALEKGSNLFPKSQENDRDYLKTDRLVLLVLALISILFALTENRVIFTFVLYAWAVLGASFGPVVIMGLLWKRTTKEGAVAGMLTGVIATVIWKNVPALSGIVYELVPAFILSFAAVVIFSLMGKRTTME